MDASDDAGQAAAPSHAQQTTADVGEPTEAEAAINEMMKDYLMRARAQPQPK